MRLGLLTTDYLVVTLALKAKYECDNVHVPIAVLVRIQVFCDVTLGNCFPIVFKHSVCHFHLQVSKGSSLLGLLNP